MADVVIELDAFAITVKTMLERLGRNVETFTPPAVEEALQRGEEAWKSNATAVLSHSYSRGGWGKIRGGAKGIVRYKSGRRQGQIKSIRWFGKTYKTGAYARSIRHQILSSGGSITEGEIGSATMPGLAHLLEKGHGGPAPAGAHMHIALAYEIAAKRLEDDVNDAVERAINET